ncbi:hypothetical protein HN371_14695 [Candidatus Poribacteria bacterium]|jgi:hypothetical protein|nr:hypothetical protein [Candidatus Poribacteria bacterium]MBT5532162.1 hypothetical protein [Candidatus Poribacteria bacterium]MBT5713395.1 hypothetical protein [Candidatus Poribacteria bacterium]MBT7100139.1 hypothetical protein [Candidatus Poribacteria bacterium]MBT7806982.1 hypothetical protein [Candidatus Poribacteria bacterium]
MILGLAVLLAATADNGTVVVGTAEELVAAVRSVADGQTILISDGAYDLPASLWIEGKSHVTLTSASADATKVILNGGGWDGGDPKDVIVIRGSDHVTISHLTIAEARLYGVKVEGVDGLPNPSEIHIDHCRFLDIGTRAVKGTATQDRNHMRGGSVRNCHFENTGTPGADWLFDGDYVSSIDMMYLDGWTFADNDFRNIRGANGGGRGAIFIWNQSRRVIVERNRFVGCDRSIAFGNPSEPTNYEDGALHNYDGIIRNNVIVVGADKGIELVWLENVLVAHNSIYCAIPTSRGIHAFQRVHGLRMLNNLVHGRVETEGDVVAEENIIGDLTDYFVDAEAGDLRLTDDAADALDAGSRIDEAPDDIDGVPRGDRVDIGAHERRQTHMGRSTEESK